MNVAYIRVSTDEQNEARQLEDMKSFGIEKCFTEKISGVSRERPKLEEMIAFVRDGDKVVVADAYVKPLNVIFDDYAVLFALCNVAALVCF